MNPRAAREAPPTIEHALAAPGVSSRHRSDGGTGRVTVVPGGHRPGKPGQLQRDRARAQLPLDGRRRVVVLGCTVGAGQTVTTLLLGETLASLRSDQIAVVDLNPGSDGSGSLAQQALVRPALGPDASVGPSRLTVITPDAPEPGGGAVADAVDPASAASAFDRASTAHHIVVADPSTSVVTRLLAIADQVVLVAPASAAAARGIGMTFEWLDAHGHADLATQAIMVMNGVSRRSVPQVEQAERLCVGRCRAIVRIPWDDQLKSQAGQHRAGLLGAATVSAATALAGVLMVALTSHGASQAEPSDTGEVSG